MGTVAYLPTPADHLAIERASAHAVAEDLLTEDARFQGGVTDLDVARLMMAVERGENFYRQNAGGRWFPPTGSPFSGRTFSSVVSEAIRTGLLIHHHTGVLIPALTHLKRWNEAQGRWESVCGTPGENMGPKRVRLVLMGTIVDCVTCADQL